jgi:N-methylhydantoinase B
LYGGGDGKVGLNLLDGAALPGKCNVRAKPGAVLRIETPGGGGWGVTKKRPRDEQT